jgi:hypothetical protein
MLVRGSSRVNSAERAPARRLRPDGRRRRQLNTGTERCRFSSLWFEPASWCGPASAYPYVSEEPSSICSPRILESLFFRFLKLPHGCSVFLRMRDVLAPTSVYSRETGVPCCNIRSAGLLGRKSGRRFDKSSNHIAGYLVRTTPRWRTTTMCSVIGAAHRGVVFAKRACAEIGKRQDASGACAARRLGNRGPPRACWPSHSGRRRLDKCGQPPR